MHTSASDGKLTPYELVKKAKTENIADIIAITDHDTTSGLYEALCAAKLMGFKVLPGIELSTLYNDENIHILGYFKDSEYKNEKFQKFLKDMADYRIFRGKKMIKNLDIYFNIKIKYEDVAKYAKNIIARPHIAKAIIEANYPYSWDYIFENFISKKSPAYVPNQNVTIKEGIDMLKSVNAAVVLAHPVLIKNTSLDELLKFDFDGIEAKYYLNSPEDTKNYINSAYNNNMFITAGSDFHGIDKNDKRHGNVGSTFLNEEEITLFLNKLKI